MASLGGRTSSTTPQYPDIPTIDIPESNSTGEPWFLRTLFSAIFSYFWFINCACVSVYTSCSRGPRGTRWQASLILKSWTAAMQRQLTFKLLSSPKRRGMMHGVFGRDQEVTYSWFGSFCCMHCVGLAMSAIHSVPDMQFQRPHSRFQ